MSDEFIVGRNSVLEALKSGRSLNKIMVAKGEKHGSVLEILGQARAQGIIVQEVETAKLEALAGGMRHQGIVASAAPVAYAELEDVFAAAEEKGEPPFLILLDEIEDPHNLGAILRTADAAGVHGVLVPKRRSAPLSAAVAKVSAGAVEYVPVVRIGNIVQTMKELKKRGLWIVGADMDGDKAFFDADLTGPIALVVGSEGAGIGRLVKENCDFLVKIPMKGKISSLKASVACSLLLYEILKQREMKHR